MIRPAARYIIPLLLFSTALLLPSGCGGDDSGNEADGEPAAERPAEAQSGRPAGPGARGPATEEAAEVTLSRMIEVGGRLKPKTSIVHTSPAEGLIRDLSVAPGSRVTAGDLLFNVDRNEAGVTFRPVPLRARIDGTVSTVAVEAEQEVANGEAAVTIIGNDGFRLEARISDKDAFTVAPGQRVTAHTADGTALTGRLLRRSPEPDYATGLFTLTFEFPPAPNAFTGAFVLVDLPAESLTGIFVPDGAVDRRYGRSFVWVAEGEEGILERREVTLGDSIRDRILVTEGLSAGERFLPRLSGREREGAPAGGGRP